MVDTNESTELWQHPKLNSKVIASFFCRHLNLGTFFHVLAKCVLPFENDVAEVAAELLQVIVDHVSRFAPQIGIFFVTKIALKRPQHLEQNYWYFCEVGLATSVTGLGELLNFGQLFQACGNNYFAQILRCQNLSFFL